MTLPDEDEEEEEREENDGDGCCCDLQSLFFYWNTLAFIVSARLLGRFGFFFYFLCSPLASDDLCHQKRRLPLLVASC